VGLGGGRDGCVGLGVGVDPSGDHSELVTLLAYSGCDNAAVIGYLIGVRPGRWDRREISV
jgi:hypothetical protein